MLFSIVVVLMVILVAAFWAYQGFFSAMLMFLETVVACVAAFAYYEDVNGLWVDSLGPGLGLPLALMLLFLGVLLFLRMLTDRLIPANVRVPLYVDRAGGAVCGFLSGEILVGMALLAIEMLPIGSSVFGFERLSVDAEGRLSENNISFLKPDRFAAGLATMLSNDRFGGENPLGRAKPDLVMSLYSGRAAPQSEARVYVPSDALTVKAMWEARSVDALISQEIGSDGKLARSFERVEPLGVSNRFLVCSVRLSTAAAKKGRDAIRFRLPQFRMVGPPPEPKGKPSRLPKVYLASAMSDLYTHKDHGPLKVDRAQAGRLVRFEPTTDFILSPAQTDAVLIGDAYEFDVAFEVPEGFEPWYIEFKRGARVDLTGQELLKEPPDRAARALGERAPAGRVGASERKVGRAPGGRTHLANAIEARTGASKLLPVPLDARHATVQRFVRDGKLGLEDGCRFSVELPEGKIPPGSQVREFAVPSDKRMIQIGAEVLKAESLFGKALSFANQTVAQVFLVGANGKEYYAIGQYAIARIGGREVLELQYYPHAEMPERCLQPPKRVTRRVLQRAGPDRSRFGFLFLVDPGVEIVRFHVARNRSQAITHIRAPE